MGRHVVYSGFFRDERAYELLQKHRDAVTKLLVSGATTQALRDFRLAPRNKFIPIVGKKRVHHVVHPVGSVTGEIPANQAFVVRWVSLRLCTNAHCRLLAVELVGIALLMGGNSTPSRAVVQSVGSRWPLAPCFAHRQISAPHLTFERRTAVARQCTELKPITPCRQDEYEGWPGQAREAQNVPACCSEAFWRSR